MDHDAAGAPMTTAAAAAAAREIIPVSLLGYCLEPSRPVSRETSRASAVGYEHIVSSHSCPHIVSSPNRSSCRERGWGAPAVTSGRGGSDTVYQCVSVRVCAWRAQQCARARAVFYLALPCEFRSKLLSLESATDTVRSLGPAKGHCPYIQLIELTPITTRLCLVCLSSIEMPVRR